MDTTGPLAGREGELARITAAIARGSGAYLVGGAGVGKSRLAEMAARWAEHHDHAVIRARATAGSSELPLGVFVTQLGATEKFLTPMFAEIRDGIVDRAAGRPVLLVVDDIDLLDDSSAVLIHQMVSSGAAVLLATLRLGRIAPGEIVDLWHRGDLERIDVGPLDEAGTAVMAQAVLGRTLDTAGRERLWAATNGNALFIREVLLSAQDGGQLAETADGVTLSALPLQSPRLIDLLQSRLAHVAPALREALVHLAFAEPCGPAELASVSDGSTLAALEAAELISVTQERSRLVLRLSHPLYGELLRAGTPLLQRRTVLGALARDLLATGIRRRPDVVKLARLAVDGGVDIDIDLLVRAASLIYHNGDPVLCERIGRRAFERSGRFDAGRELANCLYQAGELEAFRDHLGAWRASATTPVEHLTVAMTEAQAEFWYAADMASALAITDRALAAVDANTDLTGDGAGPEELVANVALFHALSGDPITGLALSVPLLDRGADAVLVRASIAAANSYGHLGRVDEAVEVLDRAVATFAEIGPEASSLSLRIVLSVRSIGNLWRGDLPRTQADINEALHNAVSDFQISAATLSAAAMYLLHGRPVTARDLAERAQEWWGRANLGSTERRWALARRTLVHASLGHIDVARAVLADYDADRSPGVVFDFEAEIGRARILQAEGFPEEARQAIRDAMATFRERHLVSAEMFTAYELVRLDRAEEVAHRMTELQLQVQGTLLPTLAQHAHALVAADSVALGQVAERFASMQVNLYAAEAAAHASDAARRAGDQRAAARWVHRAAEFRGQCEATASPTAIVESGPVALTRREREIAVLAAQGLASKEIGERLYISRRTAENHLARVYDKLGVRTRGELARVLDGGVATMAS